MANSETPQDATFANHMDPALATDLVSFEDDLDQEDLASHRHGRCTPAEARRRLEEGNALFLRGIHDHQMHSEAKREGLVRDGQHPFAVVVACSDSRVQPVVSFSLCFGDLFVVRSIGNFVDRVEEASVEYGVGHLGAPLVVVLGHTHCGLVHAALTGEADGVAKTVADEVAAILGDEADPREAERKHVLHQVEVLKRNPIIAQAVTGGACEVVGAVYHIGSGRVEWL